MNYKKVVFIHLILILFLENVFSFDYKASTYLNNINNAQKSYYNQVIAMYDNLLKKQPDADILLEKCRFIESVQYDSQSEENPNYDEWKECSDKLFKLYPDNIDVLLYKLEQTYGDELINSANQILQLYKDTKNNFPKNKIAIIYLKLANQYSYNSDKTEEAFSAASKALEYDNKIKIQILMTNLYVKKGLKGTARDYIIGNFSSLTSAEIKEAADILLEIGYPKDALQFYEKILDDKNIYFDYSKVANAYEEYGNIEKSRIFLEKNIENSYFKQDALRKLFLFDLKNSSSEKTYNSFRAYHDPGFYTDPFSCYALLLFIKQPSLNFKIFDWIGIFLIIAGLLICLILPYLWILPLHYIGTYINRNKLERETLFSLKYFWIISSFFLLITFLSLLIFNYESLLGLFKENSFQESTTNNDAISFLFECIFMSLVSLGLLYKTKNWALLKPVKLKGDIIKLIIFLIIVYYIVFAINRLIFPNIPQEQLKEITGLVTNITYIKELMTHFGLISTLVIVAVIVPVYEEFIFRGIILQSLYKYFPFWIGNCLQAIIFASLHADIKLFIAYFTMGIIFGILYKKTNTIFTSIIFHALNNAFYVLVLYQFLHHLNMLKQL